MCPALGAALSQVLIAVLPRLLSAFAAPLPLEPSGPRPACTGASSSSCSPSRCPRTSTSSSSSTTTTAASSTTARSPPAGGPRPARSRRCPGPCPAGSPSRCPGPGPCPAGIRRPARSPPRRRPALSRRGPLRASSPRPTTSRKAAWRTTGCGPTAPAAGGWARPAPPGRPRRWNARTATSKSSPAASRRNRYGGRRRVSCPALAPSPGSAPGRLRGSSRCRPPWGGVEGKGRPGCKGGAGPWARRPGAAGHGGAGRPRGSAERRVGAGKGGEGDPRAAACRGVSPAEPFGARPATLKKSVYLTLSGETRPCARPPWKTLSPSTEHPSWGGKKKKSHHGSFVPAEGSPGRGAVAGRAGRGPLTVPPRPWGDRPGPAAPCELPPPPGAERVVFTPRWGRCFGGVCTPDRNSLSLVVVGGLRARAGEGGQPSPPGRAHGAGQGKELSCAVGR